MGKLCLKCGKVLSNDEKAIYRKLVNRGSEEFMCIDCLAAHFKCGKKLIEDKIMYFRQYGCSLFRTDHDSGWDYE